MYKVTHYDYLISCPSDVKDEIQIIKDIINYHNITIGEKNGYYIRAKHWSTDSYPDSGSHGQELINKQIVDASDAVIAIFWTRFGASTQKYESGTEEEIEKLLTQNRPVMLYFSDCNTSPKILNSLDGKEQYSKIENFREKYKKKGLYSTYDSLEKFKKLFKRDLQNHCDNYCLDYIQKDINNLDKNTSKNTNYKNNENISKNRFKSLAKRLIYFMEQNDFNVVRNIFEESIAQEVSHYFKKLLSETPNFKRVKFQILLEEVYNISKDNEMVREQCCFYMGCLNTKRTNYFLKDIFNKESSMLVLRGVYFALNNLNYNEEPLNI